LASVIANARSLEDRIPGCQFLALITGKENTYFERSLEKLGCTAEDRAKIPNEQVTTDFCNLMREVAMGGNLGEMLSVLVVAEWSYQSWGEKVLPFTNRDDFTTYEWVDLHSGTYFSEVVTYLRGLLDKEGTLIDEEGKKKCKDAFLRAIKLEEEFFEMAYAP
jgi:thiaminase/transcriptional activator TenA